MNPDPLQIRLSWEDPVTGDRRQPVVQFPIALGRILESMPAELNGDRVCRIVLDSLEVSRFHTSIEIENSNWVAIDRGSRNGTFVNGQRHTRCILTNGDLLRIGPYDIIFSVASSTPTSAPSVPSTIIFNPETGLPDSNVNVPLTPSPLSSSQQSTRFPPPAFLHTEIVALQDLHATGLRVQETDYAAIGAGLGSFIWIDLLRICGVKTNQIVALGIEEKPYARYRQLCLNSQIPLHERLRSNSDSCPDNIWGWPSYALREAWRDLFTPHMGAAFKSLWQVFAEPTFAETYTPRARNVFASIDREADRIGWRDIFRFGRVRAIRKTEDGRYAIAYSLTTENQRDRAFLLARYVHLATGYPAIQFLPDLQAYRLTTGDFKSVVNAYENHEHVYQQLEEKGGTVLLRGRGIVASRIVQRIYEARQHNRNIQILHLMRSPKPQGNTFDRAKRQVENHFEFQPFNWPKACWGGELRQMLEDAEPQQRSQLFRDWGGTTTAQRSDWQSIMEEGLTQGWYQIAFGEVEQVERTSSGTLTYISEKSFSGQLKLDADFIIDATGLDAKVQTNPLLDDLVTCYNLPLNEIGRLSVTNDFELIEMRNQRGRMYAAGAITLGGPYAPVDSFLGLQYAALRSLDSLFDARANRLCRLHPLRSLDQWFRWVVARAP